MVMLVDCEFGFPIQTGRERASALRTAPLNIPPPDRKPGMEELELKSRSKLKRKNNCRGLEAEKFRAWQIMCD